MTRDDVIRMAREAGGHELARIEGAQDSVVAIIGNDAIVRFAALVAAHEREECAKVCDLPDFYEDWEIAGGAEGRELMNELAAAIRARR